MSEEERGGEGEEERGAERRSTVRGKLVGCSVNAAGIGESSM